MLIRKLPTKPELDAPVPIFQERARLGVFLSQIFEAL